MCGRRSRWPLTVRRLSPRPFRARASSPAPPRLATLIGSCRPEQLPYKQDVEGAKKLLAEAGFPNGFKSTLKTTGAIPEQAANAVELKNQLQAVGIDLSIEQLEVGAHTKATRRWHPR